LKYTTSGGMPVKHTPRAYLADHPFLTDTVLHNRKTDNDRQIINKQHAAAQINQRTNPHNKQKTETDTGRSAACDFLLVIHIHIASLVAFMK